MIDGKSIALVIPTIRENCFNDFVDRWESIGLFKHIDQFFVVEDNPTRTFKIDQNIHPGLFHYSWEDITRMGDSEWIIPRRSDTVRSYGYLQAYRSGCNLILTLDDDCYPPTADKDGLEYGGLGFLKSHIAALGRNRWFNTLNSVKPRGIPFYNLGTQFDRIIVNHGLWTNVLDYDAPYQLANPIKEEFSFDSRVVPAGFYFPMCGMNVMWQRNATVLMYHLLMGRRKAMTDNVPNLDKDGLIKLPFDRFGDIWCGIFMKKIADDNSLFVTTGMPYIRHERASNPFTNLKKEANGIEVNEHLWEHVDRCVFNREILGDLSQCYAHLGNHVRTFTKAFPQYSEHEQYFDLLGKAMVQWSVYFREAR